MGIIKARGRSIAANDPYMRWWMKKDIGRTLANKYTYHIWEDANRLDCTGSSIPIERVRHLIRTIRFRVGPVRKEQSVRL